MNDNHFIELSNNKRSPYLFAIKLLQEIANPFTLYSI